MSEKLWLVSNGEAEELREPCDVDGDNEIMVIAEDRVDALRIAALYDAGQAAADNHAWPAWHGQTISAVSWKTVVPSRRAIRYHVEVLDNAGGMWSGGYTALRGVEQIASTERYNAAGNTLVLLDVTPSDDGVDAAYIEELLEEDENVIEYRGYER